MAKQPNAASAPQKPAPDKAAQAKPAVDKETPQADASKIDESKTDAVKDEPKPAPAPSAPVQQPLKVAPLGIGSWRPRESGVFFNAHEIVPDAGVPFEAVLERGFWANISQKLRPGDTLLVFPRDARWYAELLVWDAGQNWAHVTAKGMAQRPEFQALEGVANDFEIARDPIDGFTVKRRSTGAKVRGNFPNHAEAQKWILEHQQALRS